MISAGDHFFFFHLQGLISRTPDCKSAVLENVLDCIETCFLWDAFIYEFWWYSELFEKSSSTSSDSSSSCTLLWILEPILLQAKKFHIWLLYFFFSYSSYNNFLFLFVPTKSCMIFSIILDGFSRHSTMYVQMYKVGENVTYSNGHLCALPGELLAY